VSDKERISRKKFIRLGAAVGLGSAGASAMAACGGGGGSAENGATPAATGAAGGGTIQAGPQIEEGEAIARESAVPENSALAFTNASTGQPAMLIHLPDGGFVAYSAVCTHQRCVVAYQSQTQKIACPCHGSVFDPANGGEVETGPAQQPLPQIPIEVRNGEVVHA
jgi:arsenite oxidase small subunit